MDDPPKDVVIDSCCDYTLTTECEGESGSEYHSSKLAKNAAGEYEIDPPPSTNLEPCSGDNSQTSHSHYNEAMLSNICLVDDNSNSIIYHTIGMDNCQDTGLQSLQISVDQCMSHQLLREVTRQRSNRRLRLLEQNSGIYNEAISDIITCDLQTTSPNFELSIKYLYSDGSSATNDYIVRGEYSMHNIFCGGPGINIIGFTRTQIGALIPAAATRRRLLGTYVGNPGIIKQPILRGTSVGNPGDAKDVVSNPGSAKSRPIKVLKDMPNVVGIGAGDDGDDDGLRDIKLCFEFATVDGLMAVGIKEDDAGNDDHDGFNPDSLVFTVGEVVGIIVFLNLILCVFVGWKKRKNGVKGYDIVKIIDSSTEFGNDSEVEMQEIDIENVEEDRL